MKIWLGRGVLPNGRKHRMLGLSIIYEGENIEVCKIIEVIQERCSENEND